MFCFVACSKIDIKLVFVVLHVGRFCEVVNNSIFMLHTFL